MYDHRSVWSLLFIEKCHRSHHRFRYNDAPLQMGPMDFDSSAVVIFAALQPCMDLEAIKWGKSTWTCDFGAPRFCCVGDNMGQSRGALCVVGSGVLRSFRRGSRRQTSLFHCVLCHVPQQSRRAPESYFVWDHSWCKRQVLTGNFFQNTAAVFC